MVANEMEAYRHIVNLALVGMTESGQESFSRSLLLHTLELKSYIAAIACPYEVLAANQTGPSPTTAVAEIPCKTLDLWLQFLFRL